MEVRPRLTTTGLPTLSEDVASATASPARGKEMRTTLLQKLRPPPLVHAWDFWVEKPPTSTSSAPDSYIPQLTNLHSITDVRAFWSVFNNFDFAILPQKTSVHLFHKSIKPVWEDPRNVRGGAWTFRCPGGASAARRGETTAVEFWKELCLLAIGETLQEAVQSDRVVFRDDICGLSFSPRWSSVLITVWNRDAEHKAGIDRVLEVVKTSMPKTLMVPDDMCYYKKHSEHQGFDHEALETAKANRSEKELAIVKEEERDAVEEKDEDPVESAKKLDKEVAKVRKILEDVRASNEAADSSTGGAAPLAATNET